MEFRHTIVHRGVLSDTVPPDVFHRLRRVSFGNIGRFRAGICRDWWG